MLKAGFSRVDVTPPLGTPLHGYYRQRFADGVLDPLELNCVALSDGENTAVIVTGDFLYVCESAATPLRRLISKKTGLDEKAIFLHGLHQHTSFRLGARAGVAAWTDDTVYLESLNRKYCDVVTMALDDMSEAVVGVASEQASEPLSFIRRFRMKDGTLSTNPGASRLDEVVGPAGEADNTVRLVRFKREDKPDIAVVNFHTHPDVISGNKFSADWPGFVRRFTEKDIDDCHCILINGPQGDTNHVDIHNRRGGYEHSKFMGRTIANSVINLWEKTEVIDTEGVSYDFELIPIPTNTRGMERVEECKELLRKHEAKELGYSPTLNELGEWGRISRIYDQPLFVKVPVSCIKAGKLAFVGWGGEPFTEYSRAAHNGAPDKFVIASCLVNGGEGYLPSKEAFDEGGYEANSSVFVPEIANILQSKAVEFLNK